MGDLLTSGPLAGRIALVTGGTRGIGRAIAERLRRDGATVTITGTQETPPALEAFGYIAADFSHAAQVRRCAEQAAALDLDILINNAGVNTIGPFTTLSSVDFDRVQHVNVHAPFELCRAVVPGLRRKGWGRIVNICSIFGVISREFRAPYSASKFALDGLTAALAAEVAVDGVLANCVSPGFVDTELTHRVLGDAGIAKAAAEVPIRRLAQPEEIAALVAWMAGPENTYISGQNIVIDGGFSRV